jgi:hypothetical protein
LSLPGVIYEVIRAGPPRSREPKTPVGETEEDGDLIGLEVPPLPDHVPCHAPDAKRGLIMPTIDEPYIAVLQAVVNGEVVV